MNHKGVQFAGYESRMQPGGPGVLEQETLQGRDKVIYLRDIGGELYAMVHTDLAEVPFRGWKAQPATKVRHRKSGRQYTVENVEVATRLIRLREDVNPNDGEPYRTRWYNIDDFDVMGLPTNPAAAKAELEAMRLRAEELQHVLAQQSSGVPPAEPPPSETPEQRKSRLYAELEALEATEAAAPVGGGGEDATAKAEGEAPRRRGRS